MTDFKAPKPMERRIEWCQLTPETWALIRSLEDSIPRNGEFVSEQEYVRRLAMAFNAKVVELA